MQTLTQVGIQPDSKISESGLERHGIFTKIVDGIKVHAVICGWVKYRNAHIHSSLGPYFVLLDPTFVDWMPIYSWVIEHPEGTIVIDTGETTLATDSLKNGGMNGWLNKHIAQLNVSENSDLNAQLTLLGIRSIDVRWVVLTHLHVDHAGGLQYFPKSEIVVAHEEYVRPSAFVEQACPSWFKPHLIGHHDDVDNVFERGHILTKAADVIIVPTPGHTLHHQSVILKTSQINLFFAGDASFSFDNVRTKFVPGINVDRQEAGRTLAKIEEYCKEYPTAYLPSHDQKSVNRFFC